MSLLETGTRAYHWVLSRWLIRNCVIASKKLRASEQDRTDVRQAAVNGHQPFSLDAAEQRQAVSAIGSQRMKQRS